jgi:RNA polymerase sigma factor (sigma-70 family)
MPTSPMTEVMQYLRGTLLPEGPGMTDGQLLECFVDRRDAAALEALLWRHGPMVWGVCRRILGNHHDAEDAFQATFLVLVRKAASVFPRAKVGNWIYGVAHQTALKARDIRARRRTRERPASHMPESAVKGRDLFHDLQPLLDLEISRLPEKYRTVIALCELGGKTVRETARQLGCPEGTVASRLARGKSMLAKRLARQGMAVTGATLAALLSRCAASASVPSSLMTSTIKAMTLVVAGQATTAGIISGTVAALTDKVVKAMFLNKLIKLVVVLLLIAPLSGAAGLIYQTQGARPANTAHASTPSRAPTVRETDKQRQANDLERLQGTWRLFSSEMDGVRLGEGRPEIKDSRLVFQGSLVTMAGKLFHSPELKMEPENVKALGTLTLDASKTPKVIVFKWDANPWLTSEYLIQRGIYALDGDHLKLCFYLPGQDTKSLLPTEFSANAGSKRSLGTWKRISQARRRGESNRAESAPVREERRNQPMTLAGHTNRVDSVKFSRDGKTVASASADGTIKLWDVKTGQHAGTLNAGTPVPCLAFSPDGRILASGSHNSTVTLWDVRTGKIIATFQAATDNVPIIIQTVAFSPDGKTLAASGENWTIKLWDVSTRKLITTIIGHSGVVLSMAFSPNGKVLASASGDGTIRLSAVFPNTGALLPAIGPQKAAKEPPSYICSLAFSPDGQTLASGGQDKAVRLWDMQTGQNIATFKGHLTVFGVAFSPDGKTLASGSDDRTVKLWDVASGKNIATFRGHTGAVTSVAFSPDGQTIASGSLDKTVKLWSMIPRENKKN